MGLRSGTVPGDEAVPDRRMKRWIGVTLVRCHLRVCHNGISDGREDGGNCGGLLYSDRGSTGGGEQ